MGNKQFNQNNFDPRMMMQQQVNVPQKVYGTYSWYRDIDRSTFLAYEKYVLAQFLPQAEAEKQRTEALESLIPGTVCFYHLYFLDLLKKGVKLEEATADQIQMYQKFE